MSFAILQLLEYSEVAAEDFKKATLTASLLAISSFHAALTPHQIANDAIFDPKAKSNGRS